MQLTVTTANDLRAGTTPEDLNNPEISVQLAGKYISQLMDLFDDDKRKTIMSYNQGQGNTLKGKEYAAEYFNRFERNLARILDKQPGDEREIG
jgi:soluble lytic murein transglycosylase-like protein